MDRTAIEEAIVSRGLRLTRQRGAVLDVVLESSQQLSAVQVYDAVRATHPEVGLTTVYRTLALLETIGAVRRLHGDEACESVVRAARSHGHSVVCGDCGRVEEFTACDISSIAAAAAAETGYAITDHFLQLTGTCKACGAPDRGDER
jgi:Fur family transcriptional regulator, ferric uptake regulator